MKIRLGFVSNSSSSSFIVQRIDWSNQNKLALTEEESKKLEEFGFRPSWTSYPDQKHDPASKEEDFITYYYDVICNEDEVLDFLIENKISFIADCHYGHYTVVYNKEKDKIVSLKNFGKMYLMYEYYPEENQEICKTLTREEWRNKAYYTFR